MTRTPKLIALAAGMMFVTAAGFFASAAEASTGNVLNCRANTRSAVIDCCQQIVKIKRPAWMMNNRSSCSKAAQCSTKTIPGTSITHVSKPKKVVVCSIAQYEPNKPDKPDKPNKPEKPNRPETPETPETPNDTQRPDIK